MYAEHRMQRELEKSAYHIYVTDALKAIAENSSKHVAGGGVYLQTRYIDVIKPKKPDNRTADEIIKQVLSGLMEEMEPVGSI